MRSAARAQWLRSVPMALDEISMTSPLLSEKLSPGTTPVPVSSAVQGAS